MTMALVLHRADGAPVSTAFHRAAFGNDDPFARQREIAWEGPGAMSAGRASFIGELEVASFPHIETIVVVEGELILTAPGAAPLVVGPQAGVVIGCGTAVRIHAGFRARFVFCAAACERPTRRGLFPLRADADFKPSATLPAEVLLDSVEGTMIAEAELWFEDVERFAKRHLSPDQYDKLNAAAPPDLEEQVKFHRAASDEAPLTEEEFVVAERLVKIAAGLRKLREEISRGVARKQAVK